MVEGHLFFAHEFELAEESIELAAWHEALSIERMSYLEQFERGQIDADAFASLDHLLSLMQVSAQAATGEKLQASCSSPIRKRGKRDQ